MGIWCGKSSRRGPIPLTIASATRHPERSRSISTALSRPSLPALLPSIHLPHPKVGFLGRLRAVPFVLLHLGALVSVFLVPVTWTAVALGVGLYFVRMFGITGGYHRYFAHRAYKTSRAFQFALAWLGGSAMQKGPLWWAGHH